MGLGKPRTIAVMYLVPILNTIFNRLDTVKASFEALRNARPYRLYIAADGHCPQFST